MKRTDPAGTARVLVVEDSAMVALHLEDTLRQAGYTVAGTAATLGEAMAMDAGRYDVALLDINLDGTPVFPFAEELKRRVKPFIFISGYDPRIRPASLRDVPYLTKPFEPEVLLKVLASLVEQAATTASNGDAQK